jgi:hypothetical protein
MTDERIEHSWDKNWQGKPKYSEKTCPTATLSTINLTWAVLGLNPGLCCEKPSAILLIYDTFSCANEISSSEIFFVVIYFHFMFEVESSNFW